MEFEGKNYSVSQLITDKLKIKVLYDKDFYEVIVDYYINIPASNSKGREEKMESFVRKIKDEELITKSNARSLLRQIMILKKLRKISKNRSDGSKNDPIEILRFEYPEIKENNELIAVFEAAKEELKLQIEEDARAPILIPRETAIKRERQPVSAMKENEGNILEPELTKLLEEEYMKKRMDQQTLDNLLSEVQVLREILQAMNLKILLGLDYVTVQPYGSTVSGFGSQSSDVDVSINTNCYIPAVEFLNLLMPFIANYSKELGE